MWIDSWLFCRSWTPGFPQVIWKSGLSMPVVYCADGLWGSHVWGESKEGFVPTRSTAYLISSLRAETGSHLRKGGEFYPCQTPSFAGHSHYRQYCSLLLDRCVLLAQRDHLRSLNDESSDGSVCWVGETKAHFSHLGEENKTSGCFVVENIWIRITIRYSQLLLTFFFHFSFRFNISVITLAPLKYDN